MYILVYFENYQIIPKVHMTNFMSLSHFPDPKSKMAAKIHDGGQFFWILLTKKLGMALKNSHAKNGACCQYVTN